MSWSLINAGVEMLHCLYASSLILMLFLIHSFRPSEMGEIICTWTQKGWLSTSPEAQELDRHQGSLSLQLFIMFSWEVVIFFLF